MASSAKSFLELNESELLYNIAMIEGNIDSNRISPEQRKLVSRGLERYQKRLLELRSAMTPEKKNVVERNANVEPEILQSEIETSNETTAATPNIKRIIPFAVGNDTDSSVVDSILIDEEKEKVWKLQPSAFFSNPNAFLRYKRNADNLNSALRNWLNRDKEKRNTLTPDAIELQKLNIAELCNTLLYLVENYCITKEYADYLLNREYSAKQSDEKGGNRITYRIGYLSEIFNKFDLKSLAYHD